MMNYQDYDTQYKGKKEALGWMLWDTATYTSGTTTQLTFFTALRATIDLSNMQLAGQLPAPQAFLVRAIRFYPKQVPRATTRAASGNAQTGVVSDIQLLINTGVLELTVGAKSYGLLPLWLLPSGGGAFGAYAADGDEPSTGILIDYATNGVPDPRNVFTLAIPIFIGPQINFRVTVTWPAALTLAGGNTSLCVGLDGDLIRPVQ